MYEMFAAKAFAEMAATVGMDWETRISLVMKLAR
jgi:hypothetical protein